MPKPHKETLLERIDALREAVVKDDIYRAMWTHDSIGVDLRNINVLEEFGMKLVRDPEHRFSMLLKPLDYEEAGNGQ